MQILFIIAKTLLPMRTIEDIINELRLITADCQSRQDPLGIFAGVYWRTTEAVRDAIRAGRFEDAERMERLDVVFAQRYIDAYALFVRGQQPSLCWQTAFRAAREQRLLLLQHLLLGMNAHILFDLGVAAAAVCPGPAIHGLKNDFNTINEVLNDKIDFFQSEISKASPIFHWFDQIGQLDERLVSGGIHMARVVAWDVALNAAQAQGEALSRYLARRDAEVAALGQSLCDLPGWLGIAAILIRLFERPGRFLVD